MKLGISNERFFDIYIKITLRYRKEVIPWKRSEFHFEQWCKREFDIKLNGNWVNITETDLMRLKLML